MSDSASSSVSDEDLLSVEENACPTCGSCSGMFTANSMNCLVEALGLALPGNGSVLATHTARRALYEEAGRAVMDITRRYYMQDDASVLPRSIANRKAFENAMALDIAMGGSTNTILHLLAAAQEAELDFTLTDIDQLSRRVPCLSKLAPSGEYLMEDVHRAGGIPAILGELRRGGPAPRGRPHHPLAPLSRHGWTPGTFAAARPRPTAVELFHAAPGCVRSATAFSQSERWDTLDTDGANGCIRDVEHADLEGRRSGGPARQPRGRRLRGEDGWRGCVDPDVHRAGRGRRVAGGRRRGDPRATASSPATCWWSATRGQAAARACRRCSTRPRS